MSITSTSGFKILVVGTIYNIIIITYVLLTVHIDVMDYRSTLDIVYKPKNIFGLIESLI